MTRPTTDPHGLLSSRGSVARLLIVSVSAVYLAVFVPAPAAGAIQEKVEAAKVAKKVEKAADPDRQKRKQTKQEKEALKEFKEEVDDYARLHSSELAKLGTQKSVVAQEVLAKAIAAKRAKARPGDVFAKEIEPLFRRLIAEQLKGPDTLDARKAVQDGNPAANPAQDEDTVNVVVRVNALYPPGASRSTVPPSLLLTLPPLPECLHYRFVGRDLILVDSVAQIIVDFLKGAAPPPPAK